MFKVFLGVMLLLSSKVGVGIVMKEADSEQPDKTETWQCLEPRHENENLIEIGESVFNCAKKNLYTSLVNNMESSCVDFGDGVTFLKESDDHLSPRDIFPSGEESASVRGLMDAYSNFLARRSVRWDLGFFYPGLVLRIGPSLNGAGVLEFGMEKRLDYNDRAKLGPGQMIVRRTILPHLLSFRMNLSHLLPLLLGIILFVGKNAFIFSKVTLALSVLLTLKSLILLQIFRQPQHQQHHPSHPVAHDPVDFGASAINPVPNVLSYNLLGHTGFIERRISSSGELEFLYVAQASTSGKADISKGT